MPDTALPTPDEQANRLFELGVPALAGFDPGHLRRAAAAMSAHDGALLVLHPDVAPASLLAPLLTRDGKNGFVVVDMSDVDQFLPLDSCAPPGPFAYAVQGLDRGDDMANWSPDEALPAFDSGGRTPLTLCEGIQWLLQQPDRLERNHCFMTIGSRLCKPTGKLDARTPAVWISNGTGRDGSGNRNAPKVGWCWAGNRHTWLGFAGAAKRESIAGAREHHLTT